MWLLTILVVLSTPCLLLADMHSQAVLHEVFEDLFNAFTPNQANCLNTAGEKYIRRFSAKHTADFLAVLKSNRKFVGLVSSPRLEATINLAKLALLLPEGDIVETGVYYGGSTSTMMRILMKYDKCDKKLWVFDSFEGLPALEKEDSLTDAKKGAFLVSKKEFINNMKLLNAWDDKKIVVTKGWFKDTCPTSPVQKIALLRLDGDLFASTWDAIDALYERVVPGGFIYVDDFGSFPGCRKAINKYRTMHEIFEPLHLSAFLDWFVDELRSGVLAEAESARLP